MDLWSTFNWILCFYWNIDMQILRQYPKLLWANSECCLLYSYTVLFLTRRYNFDYNNLSVIWRNVFDFQGNSQRPPSTTSVPTDLRVNTTALNAVALSSVAKYWVLTNLLPGPIPQVSVYGLPGSTRNDSQGKIIQVLVNILRFLVYLYTQVNTIGPLYVK